MEKRTLEITAANVTFCGVTIKKGETLDTDRMFELTQNLPNKLDGEAIIRAAIRRLIKIGAAVEKKTVVEKVKEITKKGKKE